MRARVLQEPGSPGGPCQDACGHDGCRDTRVAARTICIYCDHRLGFARRYYQIDRLLVHVSCHDDPRTK